MENNYIDINKGFHRVGTFSPFDDEVYNSLEEAKEYAAGGRTRTSAYPGQMIRVLSKDDEPKMFLVDNSFHLVSVAETLSTDSKLSVEFNYTTGSGVVSIALPEGYVLNTITIKVDQPFAQGAELSVGRYIENADKKEAIEYIIPSDMLLIDGEEGDEFVFNFTEVLNKKTRIYIFLTLPILPDGEEQTGKGILKIN